MTTNRDFDRLARAWLDLMPDEAPDRLIANVRLAVDVTPQERRWGWRAIRRSFQMNRPMLIAATAVVALALVGGGILLVGSKPTTTVPPATSTPAPTTTPSEAASPEAGTDLPANLIAGWYGGASDLPSLVPGAGTILFLDANQAHLAQSNQQDAALLRESASMVGGRLQLVSQFAENYAGGVSCPRGTTGLYDVSTSASGNTLTIEGFSDPCAARAEVLVGTWWKKGCHDDNACYGDLDAAAYGTQYFDPRVDPAAPWAPRFGGMQFVVQAGWALVEDFPQYVALERSSDYALDAAGTDHPFAWISIVAQPFPKVGGGECSSTATPSLGDPRSPTDIVKFLQAETWLTVSRPTTNMIDGHITTVLDLSIAPGATPGCPGELKPGGEYLTGFGLDSWGVGLEGSRQTRLYLIDLGDGDVVAVTVEHDDPAQFDAFLTEARPIVESLHFE